MPLIAEAPAPPLVIAAPAPVSPPPRDSCLFMHRMPVIPCTGEVYTCAVPGAALAGRLGEATTFAEIWNGPVFRGVRAALDTDHEWAQCRTCWDREGRFAAQQELANHGRRYDAGETAQTAGRLTFVTGKQ